MCCIAGSLLRWLYGFMANRIRLRRELAIVFGDLHLENSPARVCRSVCLYSWAAWKVRESFLAQPFRSASGWLFSNFRSRSSARKVNICWRGLCVCFVLSCFPFLVVWTYTQTHKHTHKYSTIDCFVWWGFWGGFVHQAHKRWNENLLFYYTKPWTNYWQQPPFCSPTFL